MGTRRGERERKREGKTESKRERERDNVGMEEVKAQVFCSARFIPVCLCDNVQTGS